MEHAKAATPPATLSWSSTEILESSKGGNPVAPPTSSSQNNNMERMLIEAEAKAQASTLIKAQPDFRPHQMLMDTPISVECGEDAAIKLTMHEGILRCYSQFFNHLCAKAKSLREQYVKSKVLRDRMASYVFPEVTAKQFEDAHMEDKAVPLILDIYEKYPLPEHQPGIKKVIDAAVDDHIIKKNVKVAHSTGGASKRQVSRDTTRDMSLAARLPLLNSRGVQGVTDQLFAKLHRIDKVESTRAKTDAVRAAAQRRVLLPDVDEITVQSLAGWIYQGTLQCQDAAQLYELMNLAVRLEVVALTETCLTKLFDAASGSIEHALGKSIPLRTLLGHGPGPADDVVKVVFANVFKDKHPPRRLLKLVIDTLASNLDMVLWMQLRDLISHVMGLQLIEAMIIRQQVKSEQSEQASVKSESNDTATEQPPLIVANKY